MDCTPGVRQIGLEQLARGIGFYKTVLQVPPAVCIQERSADLPMQEIWFPPTTLTYFVQSVECSPSGLSIIYVYGE